MNESQGTSQINKSLPWECEKGETVFKDKSSLAHRQRWKGGLEAEGTARARAQK